MYKLIISSLIFCIACINETEVSVVHSGSGTETSAGLKYLALGDSYTIGESVPETDRWPVLFAKSMGDNGRMISTTDILAKTGWTTANLLGACNGFKPKETYDLVSLLIGVNNQYQGRSIDEFRTDFHTLLLSSIEYTGNRRTRVFVLSIPDWGCTEFGSGNREEVGKSIDKFNAVAKEECEKEKILFVDITPISRKALNDPTMVAVDNLHYSKKMHQLWVDEALPAVKPLLSL